MPEIHEFWDPNEWELHAFGLLQDRHGPLNVQKVPARHKGDLGLDYYSLNVKVVYQCYAVQEPLDVADRAEKQKTKITTDIRKFCGKRSELARLFGGTRIDRWILIVPLHDSVQVNAHTTSKTIEVRSLGVPYASPEFEVMIQDLDSFDVASRGSRMAQRSSIAIAGRSASPEEIEEWAKAWNPLVHRLTTKLRKRVCGRDPGELESFVIETIGWFLERENVLEDLRLRAPELHEAIAGAISRRATRLRLSGPPPDGTAHALLRDELDQLSAELQLSVPNLAPNSTQQLALGTIAEWLMRCPLDFPPYDNGR